MNTRPIRADGGALPCEPVYLVLESDPLVAEDIVGSLKAIGPCRVIRVGAANSLPDTLQNETDVSAAFLDVKYAKVLENRLDEMLSRRGARIVLTVGEDDEAEAKAHGWGMLVRPFTDIMIRDVVSPRHLS